MFLYLFRFINEVNRIDNEYTDFKAGLNQLK